MLQELKTKDHTKLLTFSTWFEHFIRDHCDVLDATFFTNETWFQLTGYVDAQNFHMWSSTNAHTHQETSLHPLKIGVWCTISRKLIVELTFFWNTNTNEKYREIVQQFIALLQPFKCHCWFQQDGQHLNTQHRRHLKCCITFLMITLLRVVYGHHAVRIMTPPSFFLWYYLKNSVYINNLATLEELQTAITLQRAQIDTKMLKNVFVNMIKCVRMCKAAHSGTLSAFHVSFLLLFGKIIAPFFTTVFYCFLGCITFCVLCIILQNYWNIQLLLQITITLSDLYTAREEQFSILVLIFPREEGRGERGCISVALFEVFTYKTIFSW